MNCPDAGTWRAWLDGEAAVPDADAHLDACHHCRATVGDVRADAAFAASAIGVLAPARQAVGAQSPPQQRRAAFSRWSRPAASAAAVVALVVVVATPAGRTAAADFLAAFRGERLTALPVQDGDMDAIAAAFENLGSVEQPPTEPTAKVATREEAHEALGMPLVRVDPATVPDSAQGRPSIKVTEAANLRFRFDEDKTRAYLARHGAGDMAIPTGYDGAELLVRVPAVALQEYPSAGGLPSLLVGQSKTVTADVEGDIDLATLRSFILGLPGLPPALVERLAAIDDWRTTLPIPIPLDHLDVENTTVNGADAVAVSEPGLGGALIWQEGGRVTGVAGALDEEELRRIAEGLRSAP